MRRASARLAEVDGVVACAEVDVAVHGAVVEGEAVRAVVAAHGKRVDAAVYFVAVGVQGAVVGGDVAVRTEVEGIGVAVDDVVAQVAAGFVFAVGAARVNGAVLDGVGLAVDAVGAARAIDDAVDVFVVVAAHGRRAVFGDAADAGFEVDFAAVVFERAVGGGAGVEVVEVLLAAGEVADARAVAAGDHFARHQAVVFDFAGLVAGFEVGLADALAVVHAAFGQYCGVVAGDDAAVGDVAGDFAVGGDARAAVEGADAPVAARVAVVVFGVAADDAAVGDVAEAGAAVDVGADTGGVLDADAVTAGAYVGVGAEVGEAAVVVVACCRRFFRGRVGFVVVGDGFAVADDEAGAFFRDGLAALGAAVDGAGAGFDVALDDAFVVDAFECGE